MNAFFAPREAVELKPAHGDPCTSCGVCCIASQCPVSLAVIGERPGPCPALGGSPGRAECGLVKHPELFAPVQTARYGTKAMSDSALLLIGSGVGCDCRINGEKINHNFYDMCEKRDNDLKDEIRNAEILWGIN